MRLLDAEPGSVVSCLSARLGREDQELRDDLRERSRRYLSVAAKVVARGDAFIAAQGAALELLKEVDPVARATWDEHFRTVLGAPAAAGANADQLETPTFFSELARRPELRAKLWPEPASSDARDAVGERHLRGLLLSSAARLGHAFIDLWLVVAQHLPTLEGDAEGGDAAPVIDAYLDRLEEQSRTPTAERGLAAYDELLAFAGNHNLILDVNLTTADRARSSSDLVRTVTGLLRAQRPVAGMSGQVNQTLVRQFRLPGYPLVMISTDLLQEGEDLHTFCSSVHHYGLAWTPSALEQRTGRVDRVRSATERRLTALPRAPEGKEKLQVHYPHLADTVERLQMRRVLRRMDEFIRLMHTDLGVAERRDGYVDIGHELLDADVGLPQPPGIVLESAFGVREEHLRARDRPLAVDASAARRAAPALRGAERERAPARGSDVRGTACARPAPRHRAAYERAWPAVQPAARVVGGPPRGPMRQPDRPDRGLARRAGPLLQPRAGERRNRPGARWVLQRDGRGGRPARSAAP